MSDSIVDMSVLPEWAQKCLCSVCGGQGWKGDPCDVESTWTCFGCGGKGDVHANPHMLTRALAMTLEATKPMHAAVLLAEWMFAAQDMPESQREMLDALEVWGNTIRQVMKGWE